MAVNSFETIALEWYKKQIPYLGKSHSKDVLRRLECNVFPYIGAYPINTIEAPSYNMIHIIEHRGSYDMSHRC